MISRDEAAEMVGELTDALSLVRSPKARTSIERAKELAEVLVSDLTGNPNVVERTASLSFEVTDLIPEMLAIQEGNTQP